MDQVIIQLLPVEQWTKKMDMNFDEVEIQNEEETKESKNF